MLKYSVEKKCSFLCRLHMVFVPVLCTGTRVRTGV